MPKDCDFETLEFTVPEEPSAGLLNGRALVELVAEVFSDDYREVVAQIRRCKGHVAGLCSGPSNEDGRRRLHNPQLKTTYARDNIRALTALSLKYRRELAKQLPEVLELALKLEETEMHLEEAWRLERQIERDSKDQKATGLYANVAAAANLLFEKHRVTHWHWSAADDGQLARIAEILRERVERSAL